MVKRSNTKNTRNPAKQTSRAPTRKRAKKRSSSAGNNRTRTVIIALVLGSLSAFGLWQCFGSDGESPLDPLGVVEDERPVDVGEGQTADPTLVNEDQLLKAEDAPGMARPSYEPPPPDQVEQDLSTIEEAGEQVEEEPTEEIEEKFPLYAVAYHFHTQVKAEPRSDSRVIGYARRGSTFRVSKRVSTKGCSRGWHELTGGGFICDGNGINVAAKPVTFAPAPPAPKLNESLPYGYMYARADNTPEFWRVPTDEEIVETEKIFDRLASRNKEPAAEKKTDPLAAALDRASEVASRQDDSQVDGGLPSAEAKPIPEPAPAPEPATLLEDGGVVDPYALPPYVHLRMAKGYFVSTDDKVTSEDRAYQRTVRGRYIPADKMFPAKPSEHTGVLINDRNPLPMVFVVGGGVKVLTRASETAPFKSGRKVSRYSRLPHLGEIKRKGRRYAQVGQNEFLPARVAAVARKVAPPEDLAPNERWIDIDLKQQTLVAYEGETPVFATIVSSGRKDFDTPQGEFRIYGKHVTITMDDTSAGEEAYSIEDVPWTQYFEEGYALHAAFWHDRFGRVRSHGCVNLTPADARRLFYWTGPHVGTGLHGQIATRENPGTRVVIHR